MIKDSDVSIILKKVWIEQFDGDLILVHERLEWGRPWYLMTRIMKINWEYFIKKN